jgi:hypothetical protein
MQTAQAYTPPIRRRNVSSARDYELFDAALESFEAGEHAEAVAKIFKHLFPDLAIDLAAGAAFAQGSSNVRVRVVDGVFTMTVPVVKLAAGGGAIAALRYALTKINGTGQLYQARLHGDDLVLEYQERIAALHPHKLIEVLRRMPVEADSHDDWMIKEFGAQPLDRAAIIEVDDGEAAIAAEVWAAHWTFVEELLKEAQRKRSIWFLGEITSYAYQRIKFLLPLGGSLMPRLGEAQNTFNNSDTDPSKRETSLHKCIKEMKAVTPAELRANLGHASYAINPLADGTPGKISEFFAPGNYMESIDKARSTGQTIEAGIALVGTYYFLLGTAVWPQEVEDALKEGIAQAAGKPWRDAANLMFAHAKHLSDTYGGDDEDDDDEDDEDEDEEEGTDE